MSRVSIVILNYNGESHLQTFLPSVVKYSTDHDIVVIDNGSSDGSLLFLSKNFPSVKIIRHEKNLGFCGGYNEGLKHIDSEIYVLLNSDVEVSENWLRPCISLLDSDESIAACQPKILSYLRKDQFEYAGAAGGFIDKFGYPFCRGRIFQKLEKDEGQYNEVVPVFWASGACLFLKAKVFQNLGGFDTRFFAHMEEIDLCWRIQNSGLKIYCNPESVVYHLGGGTLKKESPQKTYFNFRNNLLTILKNSSSAKLWQIIPARIFMDLLALFVFTLRDGFPHGMAVIKAYISVIRLKEKRDYKLTNVKLSGIYPKSIVFSHYMRRKGKFSNLRFD